MFYNEKYIKCEQCGREGFEIQTHFTLVLGGTFYRL